MSFPTCKETETQLILPTDISPIHLTSNKSTTQILISHFKKPKNFKIMYVSDRTPNVYFTNTHKTQYYPIPAQLYQRDTWHFPSKEYESLWAFLCAHRYHLPETDTETLVKERPNTIPKLQLSLVSGTHSICWDKAKCHTVTTVQFLTVTARTSLQSLH